MGRYTGTSISLSGKTKYNLIHLSGNVASDEYSVPPEVQNLKILIMNMIIIPCIAKNWKVLQENICFLDKINKKIELYSILYPSDYLSLYKDIIIAFELITVQHMEIVDLENKLSKLYGDVDNVSTLVFKTSMIRLKPEYEIYNLIYGRPCSGLLYDKNIICDILGLFDLEDITFDAIKQYIIKKYGVIKI